MSTEIVSWLRRRLTVRAYVPQQVVQQWMPPVGPDGTMDLATVQAVQAAQAVHAVQAAQVQAIQAVPVQTVQPG